MTRILSTVALACLVGTVGLSAQMKHVDLKDAKRNSVGMAMMHLPRTSASASSST
jgi:hypothetical protein